MFPGIRITSCNPSAVLFTENCSGVANADVRVALLMYAVFLNSVSEVLAWRIARKPMAMGEFEIWWGTIKISYIIESLGHGLNCYSLYVKNWKKLSSIAVDRGVARGHCQPLTTHSYLVRWLKEFLNFLIIAWLKNKYWFYIYLYSQS